MRAPMRPALARLPSVGFALTAVGFVVAVLLADSACASASSGDGSLSLAVAVLLGAVQGATEFLPVSSSGHLALAQAWLGVDPEVAGHRFAIVLHAGTLLAVLWLYRKDVLAIARVVLRPMDDSPERGMLLAMFVATLPLGLVLVPGVEPAIVAVEQSPRLVGAMLLVTATILMVSFRGSSAVPDEPDKTPPSLPRAIGIGLAQLMAVLPGISRSGSTIAAGLALKLDREQAARFSFLISIPAIAGATVREIAKVASGPGLDSIPWLAYGAGFAASLLVGLVCLGWLLRLVRRGQIVGFVVYLAVVGGIAIVVGSV